MKNFSITEFKETPTQLTINFRKPSIRYLDEFVKLKCAPDLLIQKMFPNAKEITESMGAYNAYRKNLMNIYNPNNDLVQCIIIGDGCTPRTGALFALRSKFKVISVDPRMRFESEYNTSKHNNIERLIMIKEKAENINWGNYILPNNHTLLVAVHSHAPLNLVITKIKPILNNDTYLISIPCCVPDNLDAELITQYEDWAILSEKRIVNLYKIKNGGLNEMQS